MRKIILLAFLLASCSEEPTPAFPKTATIAPEDSALIMPAESSVMDRMNVLINSTENAERKVTEIKTLKKENVQLKQELVVTKAQLEEVKAIMADTSEGVKKKKRNFLQKIVDSIKKDTVK